MKVYKIEQYHAIEKCQNANMSGLFYRLKNGNAQIFESDGSVATRIDANVYPVGSQLSAKYEHPRGIILTIADAKKLGIPEE